MAVLNRSTLNRVSYQNYEYKVLKYIGPSLNMLYLVWRTVFFLGVLRLRLLWLGTWLVKKSSMGSHS